MIKEWMRRGSVYTDAKQTMWAGSAYLQDDGSVKFEVEVKGDGPHCFCLKYATGPDGTIERLL